MLYIVAAAIMWLAPALPHAKVRQYADLIAFESRWYKVDPLLVVSIIQIESGWNARKRSQTNDYGLNQVHVAQRGSARFLNNEEALFDPRTNIREGVRVLAMWRNYHERWCKGATHRFVSHFKWGRKIKTTDHAERVHALRDLLRRRFKVVPNI